MADKVTVDRLTAQAAELQAAVDASQSREAAQDAFDKETIATLTVQRDGLQAIIDEGNGATDAQLQAVVAALDSTIADINEPFPAPV